MGRLARWGVLCCAVLLAGCSATLTCLSPPGGEPLLEMSYAEYTGGSHAITLARVYSSGLLEIEPLGQRRRCRRIASTVVSPLRARVDSESFLPLLEQSKKKVAKSPDRIQEDLLIVRGPGFRAHFPADLATGVLREVVLEMDSILREEFPRLSEEYLFEVEEGIAVYYSSGGPAPSMGVVQVLRDGRVIARNQRGHSRRRELSEHPALRGLMASLTTGELAEGLATLAARRYGETYFDYEELVFEAPGFTVSIPVEKLDELPASLLPILEHFETLAQVVLGDDLDFRLVSGDPQSGDH